ncbi:uncharacterized protein LOC122547936 isoform X1 [Chiloscyllium plagiosum]|uniref:uncharacterized protein LOC122547936 isoform X1 n=1 Tax=Chiloscyllium plagiosum TaxID=36176 RepID=UPI001CB8240E|nr:uncharacterized protein LOC122547936 isoform X1 [Chiloscyllium plagiosum]XP_043542429.1 uncharacterized protein LOC122547936 isoform X1 [Chiloscyllium plagiosum]
MDSGRSYIDHTPLGDQIGVMPDSLTGHLQKYLYNGEYLLFKKAPVFESDFIQITKKGQVINIHNQVSIVTIGLTSTNPDLHLPDVMLLARPSEQPATRELSSQDSSLSSDPLFGKSSAVLPWSLAPSPMNSWCSETAQSQPSPSDTDFTPEHRLELKGLLPLKLVKLSVFHKQKHRLKVTLASGRSFYLQLYVQPDCEQEVFQQWVKIVHLLQEEAHRKHCPGRELAQLRRSSAHLKTSKGSQRDTGSPERDKWECGDWKKDPKGGNILNVLTEKSLWESSEEEGLICSPGSLSQLPVTVTCQYSPTDTRPPFTTCIDSRVFYLGEPENLTQEDISPAGQRQEEAGVTGADCHSVSNIQNLPQETLKQGKERQKEKDGRKNSKKGKSPPLQDEKCFKEQTITKRTRLKDTANLMPKRSEEQRRAEIILWMRKAEEEEKKHREQNKLKKDNVSAQS